jgi:hypothetical protein
MKRLGSLLLAGVLLGVPRALEARTFGLQRSVYIDVSPLAPELQAFARDLERALVDNAYTLADDPSRATVVVEVRTATTTGAVAARRPSEAVLVSVREGKALRPLVLHYAPEQRAAAARALLDRLAVARPIES